MDSDNVISHHANSQQSIAPVSGTIEWIYKAVFVVLLSCPSVFHKDRHAHQAQIKKSALSDVISSLRLNHHGIVTLRTRFT